MSSVFKALADPTRRKVLELLRRQPMTAGELSAHFPVSKPTMSAHFHVLKEAGLVDADKQGTTITYRLTLSVLEDALLGAEFAQRAVQMMIGLVLAGYANLVPKQIGARHLSLDAEVRVQTARRAGGWSLTLAGLAYAVIWGVAPLGIAPMASIVAVGAGLAITAGCALWACRHIGTPGAAPGS